MAKKICMICGMVVTEEEFNRVCKDEGVSDFPKRRLKPKMHPYDEDEFEVDPGPVCLDCMELSETNRLKLLAAADRIEGEADGKD